jgi:UDP:flavonoid glycosyltransferase YjiC (YdhE family)
VDPVRVLFTLLPAVGSLHPLVPVARALVEAGHEVRFASSAAFHPAVAAHGFEFCPVGVDFQFSQPDYFPTLVAHAGVAMPDMAALSGHERHTWVTENLFIGAVARRALPDVLALAETWPPDLVVRDSSEFSGCIAAEALGVPHASVAAAADAALDRRHLTAAALEPLRDAAGLPPDPDAEMIYRYLHLSFMPSAFFGPGARFPATVRFLRHVDAPRPGQPVPAWWDEHRDRQTALVSLGTIFFRTPGLYDAIVTGLAGLGLTVAVAVGHEQEVPPVRHPSPDVHVEPALPIPALLGRCAVFVTHGGFNSVKEAVSAAVPMLVVPIASDQHYSADRCEALRIGRVVRPDARTPGHIREQAAAVLADPGYRRRAGELAAAAAALPSTDHAVTLLEELVPPHGERPR